MKKQLLLALLALGVLLTGAFAFAQEQAPADPGSPHITFPISELGNCGSKDECKAYCDASAHVDACIAFGERSGLMKKEEAKVARDFSKQTGPGGCRGVECKTYCEDSAHFDACVAFAKERGLQPPPEQATKIIQAIKDNGGPGGCKSFEECSTFCSDPGNHDACRTFATEHQLDVGDNVQNVDQQGPQIDESKAEAVLKEKGGPGGCTTSASCAARSLVTSAIVPSIRNGRPVPSSSRSPSPWTQRGVPVSTRLIRYRRSNG